MDIAVLSEKAISSRVVLCFVARFVESCGGVPIHHPVAIWIAVQRCH